MRRKVRKTTDCADCDRKCESCGKMGATRGPCPFASEIRDDFRPVNLCKECRQYREKDLQRLMDAQ